MLTGLRRLELKVLTAYSEVMVSFRVEAEAPDGHAFGGTLAQSRNDFHVKLEELHDEKTPLLRGEEDQAAALSAACLEGLEAGASCLSPMAGMIDLP